MSRFMLLLACFTVATSSLWLSGCGGGDSKSGDPSATGNDENDDGADVNHDKDTSEIAKALSKLSDEDRKLAEAQKTCPVGGGPLGAMGTPVKLDVKGQPVFICCDSCKSTVDDDPDAVLAKLKKD